MSLSRSLKRRQYVEGRKLTKEEAHQLSLDPWVPEEHREMIEYVIWKGARHNDIYRKRLRDAEPDLV